MLFLLLAVLQETVASHTAKTGKAFMMELRRCLSHENFKLIMEALQSYKTADDLNNLLATVAEPLIQDHNTHSLLRGAQSQQIHIVNWARQNLMTFVSAWNLVNILQSKLTINLTHKIKCRFRIGLHE